MKAERAQVTLGTMADLGLDGKLIQDVSAIMKGWSSIEKRSCRSCRKRLVGVVGDGSVQIVNPRCRDRNDPLTQCDDCLGKNPA